LLIDATPTRALLDLAVAAGVTLRDVADRGGLSSRHLWNTRRGGHPLVQRRWAARVETAVRELCDERLAALGALGDRLDFLAGDVARGPHCWPTKDLLDHVARRGIVLHTVLDASDRRYLYRNKLLDTARADRICLALDVMPSEVWDTWFALEEAEAS